MVSPTVLEEVDATLPVVLDAAPSRIPATSRSLVIVRGANFHPASTCRFGDQEIAAAYVSSSLLKCAAPPRVPSDVLLQISAFGGPYSATFARITYEADVSVLSLSPSRGPAAGGTSVSDGLSLGMAVVNGPAARAALAPRARRAHLTSLLAL